MRKKTLSFAMMVVVFLCVFCLTSCGCKHENLEFVSDTSTCETAGKITYHCKDCDKDVVKDGKALGHNHVIEISNTATCTEGGTKTLKCSRCSSVKTEQSTRLGHDYGDGIKCIRCGSVQYGYEEFTISYSSGVYRAKTGTKTFYDSNMREKAAGGLALIFNENSSTVTFSVSATTTGYALFKVELYDNSGKMIGSSMIYILNFGGESKTIDLASPAKNGDVFYWKYSVA